MNDLKLVVGIDASRNRSGGAIAHLKGILSEYDPTKHGIKEIHVWSYRSLLDQLPDTPWLIKHNPKALEKSLINQLIWQSKKLVIEASSVNCDILFSTDASTLCRFKPMVVLSQDLLSYEPGAMRSYGYGISRLRLLTILILQNFAFKRSSGVIFLTNYSSKIIQNSCGSLPFTTVIGHGVDASFRITSSLDKWPFSGERPIKCLYVSNAELYKHQWVVVEAISKLRNKGYNLTLNLVGGGKGAAQKLLNKAINIFDPKRVFVNQLQFLPHSELPPLFEDADLFVFASSCENMPVTLVEAMSVGLPIACSNRGPMPEILSDAGVYFNPEEADSISHAIESIIQSSNLRFSIASRAKELSIQFSWNRCSDKTFSFIAETYRRSIK